MAGKLRGLYAVTPECHDRDRLLADVGAALRGGCRFVQYRDKTSAAPERVALCSMWSIVAVPSWTSPMRWIIPV